MHKFKNKTRLKKMYMKKTNAAVSSTSFIVSRKMECKCYRKDTTHHGRFQNVR